MFSLVLVLLATALVGVLVNGNDLAFSSIPPSLLGKIDFTGAFDLFLDLFGLAGGFVEAQEFHWA